MRFTFSALVLAGSLFALGYYPSAIHDSPGGLTGLICGIVLALFLMVPGYFALRWALVKSQKTFMVVFGAGFVVRLIFLVLFFILYVLIIKEGLFSFAAGFAVCYLILTTLEILSFKSAFKGGSNSTPSHPGEA